jgi:hypothetical protein
VDSFEEYLREQQGRALPKSQFGKAINYALNQWEALLLYASDGRLEIDNNSSGDENGSEMKTRDENGSELFVNRSDPFPPRR